MKNIFKSVFKSVGHGIKNDPEVQRLRHKYPRFFNFIKKRLTPSEKYGLYLTIGSLITFFFIYLFFGIIQDYIGQDPLVRADPRIINLVSHFRSPGVNQFMLFITYLAKGEIITVAVIFSLIILFLLRKWSYFRSLLIFVLGGELFVWIIKNIIERPRPPLAESLVIENSYSFPSGHSFVAIAFYGLITFFIFESLKRKWLKILTLVLGIILILLIGASRIYLGAHWPSDVLASFASGLAWLTLIITISHIKKKFNPKIIHPPHLKHKTVVKISLLLIVLFFIFIRRFYLTHPLKQIDVISNPKTIIQTNQIDNKLFANLPKISETITGAPAEPINIIVIANQETLNKAFVSSGWFLLDKISLKTSLKIVEAVIKKESYPTTPGLPVFWDTRSNDIGFGKPTLENLASSRHHIHFWETSFITPDGQSIWVGTAHFDQSIQKKGFLILPIHSTELIVDKEREELKSDLEKNGFVKSSEKIDMTGLSYGTKKSGNNFLTDGQAYILYLQDK
ncbi:MAG: LssY C-terminal domain-containing protein [Candidatus Shapirobacteria bacterium]|nr:LssY C-terminal domain-containing protein [Candidatus Shapirobacteria bacterium]